MSCADFARRDSSPSCAELSTLNRNLARLTSLLRQGRVQAALEYRRMLDTLCAEVREHLAMAAALLAELRPASTVPRRITARTSRHRVI